MTLKETLISGLVLIATCTTYAQTGLLLSGDTIGIFRPVDSSAAVVTRSSESWISSFRTGVPTKDSFQSGAQFNRHSFANVGDGDTFSSGLITYFNGLNRIGTSSGTALLDLFLQLDGTGNLIPLTTINFRIEATANSRGQATPDIFRASFSQPEPLWLGDQWIKFTVAGLPDFFQLGENANLDLGHLTVAVIPEPATIALLLGGVTGCFVQFARRRSARLA